MRQTIAGDTVISINFHRLRLVLKATELVRLKFDQSGLIYALLAEANGKALKIEPFLPSGVIIEPVERCRPDIAPHQPWVFGLTLIANSTNEARETTKRIRQGLAQMGRSQARPGLTLGGNQQTGTGPV